jgi:hypothetical protein
MFEWFSAKIAVSIAALVMVVFVLSFFFLQQSGFEQDEFHNMAQTIANKINEVSRASCNTTMWVTFDHNFDEEQGNVYVSGQFRDEQYYINITHNEVMLQQDDMGVAAQLHFDIHTYNPFEQSQYEGKDTYEYFITRDDLYKLDENQDTAYLQFKSGGSGEGKAGDIKLERKLIEVSGHKEYHTFVYLEIQQWYNE